MKNIIPSKRSTLSILVDNEPGVLARVIGLFSGRGYNIESLTVAEIDSKEAISRISIVTSGTPKVLEQIKAQLRRIIAVHDIADLSDSGFDVERELALVKIVNTGNNRIESLRIAQTFRAHTIDSTLNSFIFEVTGSSKKLAAFISLMSALGKIEVARSGVCAMSRGEISSLKTRDDLI